MAHFDVGVIPHVVNEMTAHMNPLKAYEYASVGIPVVATPVANLPAFEMVTTAAGADAFIDAVGDAMRSPRRSPAELARLLAGETWPDRIDALLTEIEVQLAHRRDPSRWTAPRP